VPDTPVTPAVQARALYWNPLLWNYATRTIRKPYVQEQMNGQWVTFSAAWHPGDHGPQTYMATEAWRLASSPPVAPPAPAQPAGPVLSPLQQAAANMNAALAASGYRKSDQPTYKAFQHAAGMTADGYPGPHTMSALATTLQSAGMTIAPVHVYPWHAAAGNSGYDGVNAPTLAEWNR
jgi:murein L,D-transpeptidase YcbB/YkuD